MANVIRRDVVEIGFDIDNNPVAKLNKEIEKLKRIIEGAIGKDAFDELSKDADKASENIKDVEENAKKTSSALERIKSASSKAFKGLKKIAGLSFKALTVGIAGAATAIGGLVTKSVAAYAEYEQLFGGVETLLGAKGAKTVEEFAKITGTSGAKAQKEYNKAMESQALVMKNANNAYKTAGMSANTYMETITTFAAALKTSVGNDTMEAAKLADVAIQDMADNANKMGTPLESVSTVYSNLARGMYMTLDNLKLGYAGTKEGAMDMVNHAAKIDKSVKANDISYANLVKAIHAVQVEMDITGTTSKECFKTITGSLNMFKAAWGNLMPALLQGGDSFDQCVNNLIDSIVGFKDEATGEIKGGLINNLLPAIEKALVGVGTLIDRLAPIIAEQFPMLAEKIIPPLIKAAVQIVQGLIKALPTIVKTLFTTLADICGEQLPVLKSFFGFFANNSGSIAKFIPVILGLVGAFMAFKKVKGAVDVVSKIFGKTKGNSEGGSDSGSGSLFDGLAKFAKTKPTLILKGMANLAIILGGFTILAAAFAAVAPHIAKLSDVKSMLEVVTIIAVLGTVGTILAKFAGIVGNIPVATVAKGLANMAIMLAGMSALLLLVGAVSLISFDYGAILKIIGIIGLLGTVGTVLSVFAGIVGLIPVAVVALGLANIAIIIAGMSALFLLIGACSLLDFDLAKITQIIGIIGLLGTVGSILSVFAGIVGIIPFPVVVAGLANIATVLTGMTAIIIAFGKLSENKGFNEFITKGGETLAQIFNVIGKMVGSLVGGALEGLTASLPQIGTNLTAFAKAIHPMISMFNGVDMNGVGNFFKAIGDFMLKMGGEKVLSFFTGGTDFAQLGTDLSTFATNSQSFFNTVATIPELGFTNATKMFECLAGLSNLPNSGGVVGWFCGDIDYTKIADGLTALSGQSVVGFFNTVSGIAPEAFENTKKLFEALSGMGSLPNTGGVVGWFSGDISYKNIADGLADLSGDGVKNFLSMIGGYEQKTFDNITAFFTALSSISDLPKEGGWWDSITGEETTTLSSIAAELKTFGTDTEAFFNQINSLNVGNLNGLWESLKNSETVSANVVDIVTTNIDDIVDKVSELPKKMADGIKAGGESLKNALVEIWKDAVKATQAPVNKLIEGANFVLKEFGSEKRIATWTAYANGTDGHKGGNALVNDGRGAELVQMPNGKTFLPQGRNVFIPNAPKGMKVLPAERTAQLMGKSSPTFRYAKGIGNFDVWEYIDNASGLISKLKENVSYAGMSSFATHIGKGMVSTISGEMTSWAKKLFDEFGAMSLAGYNPSAGVNQWRSTVIRALKMEGLYSEDNVRRTLFQMQTESGGNPHAINLWDSNAKKGVPSKGLMQVIDPTFKAYARAGFDKNIYDPLSNILASIRYAVARYGSLAKAYRGVGYANGGFANKPSIFGEDGLEAAIPLSTDKRRRALDLYYQTGRKLGLSSYTPESDAHNYSQTNVENNEYAPVFNFNISGGGDTRATARAVKRAAKEALQEMIESMDRRTPKTVEI